MQSSRLLYVLGRGEGGVFGKHVETPLVRILPLHLPEYWVVNNISISSASSSENFTGRKRPGFA